MARASVIMVQGTASSAGKSLMVAALCRHFAREGVRVAPFKAQNMSNNAAVTPEGGEIGRAQALQARACGIAPHVDMNPVLLKPQSDRSSQVVVLGRAQGHLGSEAYREGRATLWPAVEGALARLRSAYELVVIEGAGSPAEINLRDGDIVNMRVALHAGAPVLLVGDIDRGGVFAALLGTLEWLAPEERALVRGFIINRFRGDATLLAPAPAMLTARTGVPVLGVVPYLRELRLPEEDAVALEQPGSPPGSASRAATIDVAVIRLPHIANFDDIDPLAAEPDVSVRYVAAADALGEPDLIVIPGTKSTLADLAWLRATAIAPAMEAARASGSAVIGLCGGYQMLGDVIRDPAGADGAPGEARGLGLLAASTNFAAAKATTLRHGAVATPLGLLRHAAGLPVAGYEIHMGRTTTADGTATPFAIDGEPEGALAADGWVLGTYLHELFHNDELRRAMLRALADRRGRAWSPAALAAEALIESELDRLTDAVAASLDMGAIRAMAGLAPASGAR